MIYFTSNMWCSKFALILGLSLTITTVMGTGPSLSQYPQVNTSPEWNSTQGPTTLCQHETFGEANNITTQKDLDGCRLALDEMTKTHGFWNISRWAGPDGGPMFWVKLYLGEQPV